MPTHPRADQAPEPVPAALLGNQGVFTWQRALRTPGLPGRPPAEVRETLYTLALWMNADGTNGRPGNTRLAVPREVTTRTLVNHLNRAVADGWLICVERGRRTGTSSRASNYQAAFPAEVFARLSEYLDPVWGQAPQGEAAPEPPAPQGEAPQIPKVQEAPAQGETQGFTLGASPAVPKVKDDQPKVKNDHSQGEAHGFHPTDHLHRPDTPISQSGVRQDDDARRWLHRQYGLTDEQASEVIAKVRAIAPTAIGNLTGYLVKMQRECDLIPIIEAVQTGRTGIAPVDHAPAAVPPADPTPTTDPASRLPSARSVTEALAAALPDQQPTRREPARDQPPPLTAIDGRATDQARPATLQRPLLTTVPCGRDEHGLPAVDERAALRARLAEINTRRTPPERQAK